MRTAAVALLLAAAAAHPQPERWTAEEWRADLAHLHEHIQTVHANPYHTTTEEALSAAIASLHERIPALSDAAIAVEMQAILAMLGDGHSNFRFWEQDLGRLLPVHLWWFDDGITITKSMQEDAQGGRIVAIDGVPIEEVLARVTPLVSRDNDMGVRAILPVYLRHGALLHAVGIAENPERIVFTLADDAGATRDLPLEAVSLSDFGRWTDDLAQRGGLPLYRRDTRTHYWYEPLPDDGAVYMQFNAVQHRDDKDLDQFFGELTAYMEENGLECLIIDARHNGGGNGMILGSIVRRIQQNERINRPGHLYLITGRRTFSAALILTLRLERRTHVLIAGEPGRGKPNSYSETGAFELPHTGLGGSVSALFRQDGLPDDDRDMVPPQIAVTLTYDDYRNGRDPVLEAVLTHWHSLHGE